MFWLSYYCFSILCDAFLLKSVISSHNSCDVTESSQKTAVHIGFEKCAWLPCIVDTVLNEFFMHNMQKAH